MLKGFKEFILRGNVIDLAVAVVIGAAFTTIVNAIVTGVFTPLISALFKADSLNNALKVPIGRSNLLFGEVLGAVIQFVLVAVVVYFVFVLPLNHFKERAARRKSKGVVNEATPTTELDLLTEIRDLLAADRDAANLDAGTLTGAGRHSD
ncbi:MAG TPA: large conductance mechanosensitive channel protein MscL [Microbacteriaceae bacterium]|nr:large conductance mechanosensitive channel protein MscL [Microbacteriaceae bacterium]